jgi:hypothetical protein
LLPRCCVTRVYTACEYDYAYCVNAYSRDCVLHKVSFPLRVHQADAKARVAAELLHPRTRPCFSWRSALADSSADADAAPGLAVECVDGAHMYMWQEQLFSAHEYPLRWQSAALRILK